MLITILSPTSINGGTDVLILCSRTAGLYEDVAVCLLTTDSVSITFSVTLKGNSIETVPHYFKNNPEISFDFMFIDGGHMGQTPYIDYKNTKNHINNNGIYVLDDMDGPSVFSGYKRHTWDNFELVKVPLIEKEIIVLKKKG